MTDKKIYKIPPLPPEILEAVNKDNLTIFIGAGVSRLVGCIGWDQLGQNLVNKCFSTKREDGSSCINYKEKETLSKNKDHKKTITICHQILKKNGFEDAFYEELEKSLKADNYLLKTQNIYKELDGLHGLFITTNADTHFDGRFNPSQIVYKIEDFNSSNIDRTKLYHIHGSILDKNSLVFTVPHYIKRYNNPNFRKFLEKIFEEYRVLFIGYGLGEFELLDFLITKFDSNKGKELKHFILRPFYKGEENILEFEQDFYREMGINVLGFELNEKGYGQLYEIIKNWNTEIKEKSRYLYDSYNEIEDIVNNYESDKAENIFQIIKNDKPQEDYFFKYLATCSNPSIWLRPLKEKEYFNPKNNPPINKIINKSFKIPYWNILGYLFNLAKKNFENPDDDITEDLLEIIDSISKYRNESGERIKNVHTDRMLIKIIFQLPKGKISEDHIDYINNFLRSDLELNLIAAELEFSALPRLLKDESRELLLKLLDIMFEFQEPKDEFIREYNSVMDKFWLNRVLKKETKQKIIELCGVDGAQIALKKIYSIIEKDDTQFNNIWIPTIEDHPITYFPDRYQCQLVYFIRDTFEVSEINLVSEKVKNLIQEKHSIFKRLSLHIINYHYENLKDIFWNWEGNPLDEYNLKHELFKLLKDKCNSFSKNQIDKIQEWIESKKYYVPDEINDDEKRKKEFLAYRKKEWYLAILETKNSDVISSYEKYHKIYPIEHEHPGFIYWMETNYSKETISSIKKADILNKTNQEIADYINTYEQEGGVKKKLHDDFLNSLEKYVSENPINFANNMLPFLHIPLKYQHILLWGLSKAWNAKKKFSWNSLLNFILKMVKADEFWKEEYEEGRYNYRKLICGQIADLIKDGTKDDNHAFDDSLHTQVEKILLILAEKEKSDISEEVDDLISKTINSSKGKIFSAMIVYSLRYARLVEKNQEDKWTINIKNDFNKRLDRDGETSLEFSVTLGMYLDNISYLDKNWVIDNINRIFPKDNISHWKATFAGYIYYASNVNKPFYLILRENNHYSKAIETNFNKIIIENLVRHICIGYLNDLENLEDDKSLIHKLIENKNVTQLSAMVSYFSRLKDELTDDMKQKIKPLWNKLFNVLDQKIDNPEFHKIISDLSNWISLVDYIDEDIFKWLNFSVKYVQPPLYSLIEGLLSHIQNNPSKIGAIFLEILRRDLYPQYEEKIQKIVRTLYNKDQKETADIICNLYGDKGYLFLKEIFEEYND